MDYTPEQHEILRHLGEASAQFDAAVSRQQTAQTTPVELNKRHGGIWRELLDTF